MQRFWMVLAFVVLVSGVSFAGSSRVAASDKECEAKGQCPLKDWMDGNMQPAFEAKDLKKLSEALKKTAALSPDPKWNEGESGWKKIAEDAAKAADSGDFAAVQASCKSCHKEWRKKYRVEHRGKPVR